MAAKPTPIIPPTWNFEKENDNRQPIWANTYGCDIDCTFDGTRSLAIRWGRNFDINLDWYTFNKFTHTTTIVYVGGFLLQGKKLYDKVVDDHKEYGITGYITVTDDSILGRNTKIYKVDIYYGKKDGSSNKTITTADTYYLPYTINLNTSVPFPNTGGGAVAALGTVDLVDKEDVVEDISYKWTLIYEAYKHRYQTFVNNIPLYYYNNDEYDDVMKSHTLHGYLFDVEHDIRYNIGIYHFDTTDMHNEGIDILVFNLDK